MADERQHAEPDDPATHLANAMIEVFEKRENSLVPSTARALVLISVDGSNCGLAGADYTDAAQMVSDLLMHARAIMRANGKELTIVPIKKDEGEPS